MTTEMWETDEDGENDLVFAGRRFTLPQRLSSVDRRLLLHQPQRVRHGTLGRRYPDMTDAAFASHVWK